MQTFFKKYSLSAIFKPSKCSLSAIFILQKCSLSADFSLDCPVLILTTTANSPQNKDADGIELPNELRDEVILLMQKQ